MTARQSAAGGDRDRPPPLIPAWAWWAAVPGWLVARALVAVAWLVVTVGEGRFPASRRLEGFVVWDGGWYLRIARDWYLAGGEEVRFSPLFAVVGRAVGLVLGDRPAAGLAITANVAALVAGALLAAYTAEVVGRRPLDPVARTGVSSSDPTGPADHTGATGPTDQAADDTEYPASAVPAARAAAVALALWPASFVLVLAYSEALFLAFTIGAALAARRDRWWLAALLGLLAGLTRPTGVLLVVLLAGLILDRWSADRTRPRGRRLAARMAALAGPGCGLAAHLALVAAVGAPPSRVVELQRELRGGFVDPLSRLVRAAVDLIGQERLGDGLHLPFALVALGLVVLTARRVHLADGAYAAMVVVLAALSAANLNSFERYVINAFPVFVAVGVTVATRPALGRILAAVGAAGVLSLAVLSWGGVYVP